MNSNDRMHRIAAIAGGAASLAWVALYGFYISSSLGLETLMVLPPDQVAGIVSALTAAAQTGKIGDGKVWTTTVDDVQRIRTGELGADAI